MCIRDRYELELEDIETAIAQVEAEIDADARTAPVRPPKPRQTNRGSLPKHLERVEVVIEPELSCAVNGGAILGHGSDGIVLSRAA